MRTAPPGTVDARRAAPNPRVVEPEVLDGLDARDRRAIRTRGDLRRIHRAMGTRTILLRALRAVGVGAASRTPLRILELGAGDGTLMLGVARVLARNGCRAQLALLDRQPVVEAATLDAFAQVGWEATALVVDVAEWIERDNARLHPVAARSPQWDVIVTTLFLHHFEQRPLTALLEAVAARANAFVACEPRRAGLALAASYCVGALGANAVTRRDAVLSVRAGFAGDELRELWPGSRASWTVREYDAGLFNHCLCAQRL